MYATIRGTTPHAGSLVRILRRLGGSDHTTTILNGYNPPSLYCVLRNIYSNCRSMSPAVSTVLKHPNEVFLTPPAPPHPWTYSMPSPPSGPSLPSPPSGPSLPWKTCNSQNIELSRVLSRLQLTLRSLHKHKVSWPADESWLSTYVRVSRQHEVMLLLRLS